jgi:hypothetical protein
VFEQIVHKIIRISRALATPLEMTGLGQVRGPVR